MNDKFTSLCEAIRNGTWKDVEEMIQAGHEVNQIGNLFSGGTLVHAAIERGDSEILKTLIRYGADVAKPDFDTRTTPMQLAT